MNLEPLNTAGKSAPENMADARLAIVLDDVSEMWQMNILTIRGRPTVATVTIDGFGPIDAPAIQLSKDQARHLAAQINELLGPVNVGRRQH